MPRSAVDMASKAPITRRDDSADKGGSDCNCFPLNRMPSRAAVDWKADEDKALGWGQGTKREVSPRYDNLKN